MLISTHSEALIITLLAAVANGEITNNDIAFYLTTRSMGVTIFTKQNISDEGQVEGGLTSFMTGELEDIESFFKAQRSKKNKKDRKKEEVISQISSKTEGAETKNESQNRATSDQ